MFFLEREYGVASGVQTSFPFAGGGGGTDVFISSSIFRDVADNPITLIKSFAFRFYGAIIKNNLRTFASDQKQRSLVYVYLYSAV